MTTAWRVAAVALLAGLIPGLASAQEHPPLTPTREATVLYRVQGPRDQAAMSVRVHVSGGRLRVEPATLPGYVIVDRGADRVLMVLRQPHAYFETSAHSGMARDFLPSERMRFTRGGTERVAGLPCTLWDVQAPEGRTGSVCVTADGIVLRGQGSDPQYGSGSLEAVSVTYAPQPAGLFQPPSGYLRMDIPSLPAGPGGAPPAR
jgi:hypothetical protein